MRPRPDSCRRSRSLRHLAVVLALLVVGSPPSVLVAADFLRGDSDGSGVLDISDPIYSLTYQFLGNTRPDCLDALDFDDSNAIDVSDPIASLAHQFLGGLPPAPPGLQFCGPDPTDDDGITCDFHPFCIDNEDPTVPDLSITSPTNLLVVGEANLQVTGTVSDEVDPLSSLDVTVNGVAAVVDVGTGVFTAVIQLTEGTNAVTAVALDPAGNAGSTTVNVMLDTQAPTLTVETPGASRNKAMPGDPDLRVDRARVTVTGYLNDIGSVQVGGFPGRVTVESSTPEGAPIVAPTEAVLEGRTFVLLDFPLRPGFNVITTRARDGVGNEANPVERIVLYQQLRGQRVVRVSGDGQSGEILTELDHPLVIVLVDDEGRPVRGRNVKFEVVRNSGFLAPAAGAATEVKRQTIFVKTGPDGRAAAYLTLGDRIGAGFNRVRATAAGFQGEVLFCATALAGLPEKILASEGPNQTGIPGEPLVRPLIALAVDREGNPIANLPVTFDVVQGGGVVGLGGEGQAGGQPGLVVPTNEEGLASVVFTLGDVEGFNTHKVIASFEGLEGSKATYYASAKSRGEARNTAVVGIVLDNQDVPVQGATCTIEGTDRTAITDAGGTFRITGAPVGTIHLKIDGSTSNRPGVWPTLVFLMSTISGQDNDVGEPIRMVEIDAAGGRMVGGDEAVTVEMAGVPGMSVTVLPGSATFPDGSRVGMLSLTQVKFDKVPMPPPNGSVFMPPSWTLQPPGVQFDPPAIVSIPNDGMAPGRVIDVFQFDHDLEMFTNVGPATTSADGSVIISDAGYGITKTGWGGCGQPPPPTTCLSSCAPCQKCENGACVADTSKNGQSCDGKSQCGVCAEGVCNPTQADGTACDDLDACTQDDECDGGVCKGRPDPSETFDNVSYMVGLGDDPVTSRLTGVLQRLHVVKDVQAKLSVGAKLVRECCPPQGHHRVNWEGYVNVTVRMREAKIKPPIPTPVPGLFLVGSVGIDVSAEASVKYDACKMCWSGGGGGKLAVPVSLAVQVGDPDIVGWDVLKLSTGVSGSVTIRGDCSGLKLCAGVQFDGVSLSSSVTFLDASVEIFNVKVIDPRALGTGCVDLPISR